MDKEGTTTNIFLNDFRINLLGLNQVLNNLESKTKEIASNVEDSKLVFTSAIDSIQPIDDFLNSFDQTIEGYSTTVWLF